MLVVVLSTVLFRLFLVAWLALSSLSLLLGSMYVVLSRRSFGAEDEAELRREMARKMRQP